MILGHTQATVYPAKSRHCDARPQPAGRRQRATVVIGRLHHSANDLKPHLEITGGKDRANIDQW